ncbi:MAG: FAD-dependent oxidoreductase [Candidatus Omnitrophota bacterium]
MSRVFELIIIGAGPAGITAAVYASRQRLDTLVLTQDVGGQAGISGDIENYTGYQFITGPELVKKFEEHLHKYDIQLKEEEKVIRVSKEDDLCVVKSEKEIYKSKTVIIASGKRSKELNVPGEKEFKNKGLTYCATCDGPLFSKKIVAVIGGGNSALDAALQLIKIAKHVYIINITSQLAGDSIMRQKVTDSNIVTILNDSQVKQVLGDKMVNAIKIRKLQPQRPQIATAETAEEQIIDVQGVFVEIGLIPNSEFTKGIEKNEFGEIKVNSRNETNIRGIFAAGDVTDVPEKQIIIAAGEGSKAALSAFRYLAQSN